MDRFQRPYRCDPWFLVAAVLFVVAAVSACADHSWRALLGSPTAFFWVGLLNLVVDNVRRPRASAD